MVKLRDVTYRGVLGFDIETNGIPDDQAGSCEGLGITCVGFADAGRNWFFGSSFNGNGETLTQTECDDVAKVLHDSLMHGVVPVTFNGLGFDFRLLHYLVSPEVQPLVVEVALSHVDICYLVLRARGFMLGMAAITKGLGIQGKLEGMDGLKAIDMWTKGTAEDRKRVLEYVAQDADAAWSAHQELIKQRKLFWTTKQGTRSVRPWIAFVAARNSLLVVWETLARPDPDTEWMDEPWDPKKFYDWTGVTDIKVGDHKLIKFV